MNVLLGCLLLQALPAADREPSPSRRLHAEVNVRYRQQIEEERKIAEYRQREPVDQPLEFASGRGRFSGRFRFESECEAPPPDQEQEGFGLPPGQPAQDLNRRRDDWPPPPWDPWNPGNPPPFEFPGRSFDSVNVRNIPVRTTMTLTGRVSKLLFNVSLQSSTVSELRNDPAVTGAGAASTPPAAGGGGGSVTPPPPSPTPGPTRLAATTSSSPQTSAGLGDEDSDAPLMAGPELSVPLSPDLSRWSALGWVPAGTSLGFSARALFGTIEVFETRADAELYGLGLGLRVPLLRWGGFQTEAGFFGGPGYLHTDFGDAWGFNGGAGLHLSLGLVKGCAVAASVEAEWFEGDGVSAWGPSVNLGLNLGW